MKKIVRKSMFVLSFLGLFIGMLGMVSCKKEKQYSCNPEINNWAQQNVDRFQIMTREQLATLPLPLAQAAYRTLAPEKKYEFWNEKFDIVYSQWDEPVREMIDDMKSHIDVTWFDPDSGIIDRDYIDSWEKTMLTEWMDSTSHYLSFCTIYTEDELNALEYSAYNSDDFWIEIPSELLKITMPSKTYPGGGSGFCTCKWNSYCSKEEACTGTNCKKKLEGCGVGWLEPCTKVCEPKEHAAY